MKTTNVSRVPLPRVSQGDIFRDIQFLEYAEERSGSVEISKIQFPYIVVLTQDCDLEQEHSVRRNPPVLNNDKELLSVLVAPLYNVEHVYAGQHLSELGFRMATINKTTTEGKRLVQNQTPRYHHLAFAESVPVVPSVVDFKHYFSVNLKYLEAAATSKFVCRMESLYREDLSQRFAAFLSRIGLP